MVGYIIMAVAFAIMIWCLECSWVKYCNKLNDEWAKHCDRINAEWMKLCKEIAEEKYDTSRTD